MSDESTEPVKGAPLLTSSYLPEGVRVYPNVWPGEALPVQPGDVTQFAPMGCCLGGGPVIMRPWDTLEGATSGGSYYGGTAHSFHPLHGAPLTEASGGVLYFDSGANIQTVLGALQLMHAPLLLEKYAVFVTEAKEPQQEGFLVHCRIMPLGALRHFFGVDFDAIPGSTAPQPMPVGELVRGFIEIHEKRYGTGMSPDLYGSMGGDGDWAKESLCFGFMMENEYHSICRIWSRAWLVTK